MASGTAVRVSTGEFWRCPGNDVAAAPADSSRLESRTWSAPDAPLAVQPLLCSAKSVARKLPVATGGLRPLLTFEVAGRTAGSEWLPPFEFGCRMTVVAESRL